MRIIDVTRLPAYPSASPDNARVPPVPAPARERDNDARESQNRPALPVARVYEGVVLPRAIPADWAAATRVLATRVGSIYDQGGAVLDTPRASPAIAAYLHYRTSDVTQGRVGTSVDQFV
jgi:hypothetical protein